MPILTTGAGAYVAAAGAAATTWNPSDKNAGITLTGSNLIATTTTGGSQCVRSVANHSSGKYYCELTFTGPDSGAYLHAIGIANVSQSLSADMGFGTSNSGGLFRADPAFYQGSGTSTGLTPAIGDVFGMAVDIDNLKIWFRQNGGSWNNDGSANPATNTNGITITVSGALYVCAEMNSNNVASAITANFGGSAYGTAAPSGFSNW